MFSLALSLVDDWNSGYVSLYIIAGKDLLLERLTLNKYIEIYQTSSNIVTKSGKRTKLELKRDIY